MNTTYVVSQLKNSHFQTIFELTDYIDCFYFSFSSTHNTLFVLPPGTQSSPDLSDVDSTPLDAYPFKYEQSTNHTSLNKT